MGIFTSAVPETSTIFNFLDRQYGLAAAAEPFARRPARLHRYEIGCDADALQDTCHEAIAAHGLRGFRNSGDDGPSPAYGSISLTCNPDGDGDPHSATLGSAHLRPGQYFYGTAATAAQMPRQKGDYYDSYSFRRLTPAGSSGALGELLRGFRLPLIRSRLSVIAGERPEASGESFGWHRDESVFHNLRINIPIWTTPDYLLEIAVRAGATTQHHLPRGQAFSWDTNQPHRVFTARATSQSRCHLVIGLAPWFDYDAATDCWTPNAYFGQVHPHDLIAEGLAHPLIRAGRRIAA